MMTSLCKESWQFLLAQGILGGLANGLVILPSMAAVGQYFNKNRGDAGLAIAGSSIGGVIFPIALNKMLHNESLGFGWSIQITGFIVLAVLLPACIAIKARLPPRRTQFWLPRAFPFALLPPAPQNMFEDSRPKARTSGLLDRIHTSALSTV